MSVRYIKHPLGSQIAIGIVGKDKKEIEYYYYLLWNHGVTSGELFWNDNWVSESGEYLAFVWTTPYKLKIGIKSIIENRYCITSNKELEDLSPSERRALKKKLLKEEKQFIESIEKTDILYFSPTQHDDTFNVNVEFFR